MCDVTNPHRDYCVNFRNSTVTQPDSHGDFSGRHYEQKTLEDSRCGRENKAADYPTGQQSWTVFVNMGDAWGDPQHRQSCPSDMAQGFPPRGSWQHKVSDNNNATWIPCQWDGSGGWDYDGCCIAKWGESNKEACCNPSNPEMDVQKCDPSWCPFSPDCLKTQSTADFCLNNVDDKRCLDACKMFNTSGTYKDRPTWCDAYVSKYCKRHQFEKDPDIDSFCSCTNTSILNPECISIKCTNNPEAWRSTDQWSKECGTICANIIEQSRNMGPEDVDHNSLQNNCSTYLSTTTTSPSSAPSAPSKPSKPADPSVPDSSNMSPSTPSKPDAPVDPTDPNLFRNQVIVHPITAYTNLFAIEGWWKTTDGWIGIAIIIGLLIGVFVIFKLISKLFSSSDSQQVKQSALSEGS